MVDIVIPYKRNRSGELEACIELIKKNVQDHGAIHVIDESPGNPPSHVDQILKLKWAIENLKITDSFYLFNDDFFVLKPVDSIAYYHRGTLNEHIASRHSRGSYTRALLNTSDALGDGLDYELHIPFLFNKQRLYSLIQSLETAIACGKCPLIRSMYGNTYNVGGEYMEDVKNVKDYEGKTFLSTTEASFRRGIGDYIRSQLT